MLDRESKPTELMAAAIRCGCQAADVHLTCSFPDCTCKVVPSAVKAAVSFAIRLAAKDFVKEATRG